MGGPGSGNRYHWHRGGKRPVVEDCLSIDANRWTREGILKAGVRRSGSWGWRFGSGRECFISYEVQTTNPHCPTLRLSYSWKHGNSGQAGSADYAVGLTTTRPHLGGLRWWFNCPLVVRGLPCERRVGKLYLPGGRRYFGCRLCHGLTYTSCQDSHKDEALFQFLARGTEYDWRDMKRALK